MMVKTRPAIRQVFSLPIAKGEIARFELNAVSATIA
jgi:hypothetical protein